MECKIARKFVLTPKSPSALISLRKTGNLAQAAPRKDSYHSIFVGDILVPKKEALLRLGFGATTSLKACGRDRQCLATASPHKPRMNRQSSDLARLLQRYPYCRLPYRHSSVWLGHERTMTRRASGLS